MRCILFASIEVQMSVNKAILLGNLTKEVAIRQASTSSVANFDIATSESWMDKNGEKQSRTEFHHIVVWGKMAEHCAKFLKKGSPVFIEGRIQSRSYDGKDGAKRYITEIQASTVQFLSRSEAPQSAPAASEDVPF
jgi:single-strand DNA-binding protein